MQYTLRNIPEFLDHALRQRATEENKSLNQVAIEALAEAVGLGARTVRYRDLADLAGTWVEDPEFDRAIEDQDRIDDEIWK
jgi:plasmid stability protein